MRRMGPNIGQCASAKLRPTFALYAHFLSSSALIMALCDGGFGALTLFLLLRYGREVGFTAANEEPVKSLQVV